jgi:hypothetical protein
MRYVAVLLLCLLVVSCAGEVVWTESDGSPIADADRFQQTYELAMVHAVRVAAHSKFRAGARNVPRGSYFYGDVIEYMASSGYLCRGVKQPREGRAEG